MRLIFPILLLSTLVGAGFLYANVTTPWRHAIFGRPFNLGLALLPLSFFALHLTNRRYGASFTCAQIGGSWLVIFATLPYWAGPPGASMPDARTAWAFAAALLIAQFSAVFVFDRLRGPKWWQAPLFASLFGGVILCLIAFPAAYAGSPGDWQQQMFDYLVLTAAAAVLLVIPYWILRSLVLPRSGFGGY